MKKYLLFTVLAFFFLKGFSQQNAFTPTDYEVIKKGIQDASSAFYYPDQLARLVLFDTTLTDEEYRYLYYGYIFQKEYKPYWVSPHEKELEKYYRSQHISPKDYDKIIQLATKSIEEYPFALRAMNFLVYIYHLKGNEDMAQKVASRLYGTVRAILSSGDGKTCETGFHVISVSHEYVLLNMFQFQLKSQSLVGNCDYLELDENNEGVEGIYFNIETLFKNQFPDKQQLR